MSSEVKTAVVEQGAVVEQSAVDLAIAASEARHKLFTAFTAHRSERKAEVLERAAAAAISPTEAFLAYGESAAQYLYDGVQAGVDRAELVADCLGEWSNGDLSRAIGLFRLAELTGVDIIGTSLRRLAPLARLVKRDEEERYTLRAAESQVSGLVSLVAAGDKATDTAAKVTALVDALLGKVRQTATHEAEASGKAEGQPPAAVAPSAPAVQPVTQAPSPTTAQDAAREALAIVEPQTGLTVEQAAERVVSALLVIGADVEQRKTVAKAVGAELIGEYPNLLGSIVAGAASYVQDKHDAEALRHYNSVRAYRALFRRSEVARLIRVVGLDHGAQSRIARRLRARLRANRPTKCRSPRRLQAASQSPSSAK
jgi:hypothetical protein